MKMEKGTEEEKKEKERIIERIIEKIRFVFSQENGNLCYTVFTFYIVRYAYQFQSKKDLFVLINELWDVVEKLENSKKKEKKELKVAKFGQKIKDFFGFGD